MAAANVVGSLLGTRLALKPGTGFVRIVFIVVVSALILKTGYDAFLRWPPGSAGSRLGPRPLRLVARAAQRPCAVCPAGLAPCLVAPRQCLLRSDIG